MLLSKKIDISRSKLEGTTKNDIESKHIKSNIRNITFNTKAIITKRKGNFNFLINPRETIEMKDNNDIKNGYSVTLNVRMKLVDKSLTNN